MSISDLWLLYSCGDPLFIDLVDQAVQRKKQAVREARDG